MDDLRPRSAADLLSFADVRDIDEFVEGLRKYESGEWTPDQFKVFRLARGTYGQRQPDVNMIRVKIPSGILNRDQLERMADVSEKYSRGFGHVTTRQNVQLHFVKLAEAAACQHELADVGLTTKEACGSTVRNVTACPMAGTCGGETFDVTPYALATTRWFLRRKENQVLPRKFKIAFSGCPDDCAFGAINDVAAIAAVKDGVRGFRVKVAGGLSTTPEDAHLLYDFLPADELIPAMTAIVGVFDANGNRQNKSRARLKYVVRKHGWEGFRALFEAELERVQREVCGKVPIDPTDGDSLSAPPARRSLPVLKAAMGAPTGYTRWRHTNVYAQKQHGWNAVTVRLVRGDITAAQMRAVGRLCEEHGDGMVRLTIDQNLVLRFVADDQLEPLYLGLQKAGLDKADANTIVDVTSCPGAETCNLAVTSSRELASALSERLDADGAASGPARDLDIKISGCPNSCGQHHIAGIGFHGGMRRVGGRIVPEYTLHLGGGIDAEGAKFGRTVVKIPARRVPDALSKLLALYDAEKQPGEPAREFFRRVPDDVVKGAVAELMKIDEATAAPEDFLDLGDNGEFVVKTGPGECAV